MGVCTGLLTLLLPVAAFGILPPSPVLPGNGPLPDAPPPLIPVDHQRCVAMKRETRRIEVPVPYFCHPRDANGIPFPQMMDQEIMLMIMRLQWSGYKVCTRQMMLPTHRYVPVPVCCPGWQRGPSGKCDMPMFTPPPALQGPCLNGGILKKNGKCCHCPPGFTGQLCQHTTPPTRPGSPFPNPRDTSPFSPSSMIRPVLHILPPQVRNRVNQLLRKGSRGPSSNRQPPKNRVLPITPTLAKRLTDPKKSPVPVNTAYINRLPSRPVNVKPVINTATINKIIRKQPVRPLVNTAYINQVPRRNSVPRRLPTNVAYINRLPQKQAVRPPAQTAHINPYVNARPVKITVNTAHINRLLKADPRRNRPVVNTAAINRLTSGSRRPGLGPRQTAHINRLLKAGPRRNRPIINTAAINRLTTGSGRPVQGPQQTAHINRLPKFPSVNQFPNTMPRIPPNSPRPVIAPPVVVAPTLGITPMLNPTAVNPVPPPVNHGANPVQPPVNQRNNPVPPPVKSEPVDEDSPDSIPPNVAAPQPLPQSQSPRVPEQTVPAMSSDDQCQRILEIGVTRCFRDAGILAGPRDVFNPQNPDVARSICSQGKRLRPCILAGETACGRGMRVILTRRMLSTLLNAIGNLCTSRPLTTPTRKPCINGGVPVNRDGRQLCDCPQGFGGELCEIPICIPACENNGLCENVDGQPRCVCTEGFYGDQCENVVPVTTVTDPKPVDPPTHSLETSSNPVPVPVPVTKIRHNAQKISHDTENKEKIVHDDTQLAKMQIFGYPLWFVLAIILGFFGFLLVIFISCCLCLRCRRSKRNFEVNKEAVKLPVMDNVYTVGVVPPVYEAKGIPPLSYEEAKGETIKGLAKQLEKEVEEKSEEEK